MESNKKKIPNSFSLHYLFCEFLIPFPVPSIPAYGQTGVLPEVAPM